MTADSREGYETSVARLIEGRWYRPRAYRRFMTGLGGLFIVWGWTMLFLGLNPDISRGSESWYVWVWFVGWNVIGWATVLAARRNGVRISTKGVEARRLVRTRTYRWEEIGGFEVSFITAWGEAIVAVLDSGERRWLIRTWRYDNDDKNELLTGLRRELAQRRLRR